MRIEKGTRWKCCIGHFLNSAENSTASALKSMYPTKQTVCEIHLNIEECTKSSLSQTLGYSKPGGIDNLVDYLKRNNFYNCIKERKGKEKELYSRV